MRTGAIALGFFVSLWAVPGAWADARAARFKVGDEVQCKVVRGKARLTGRVLGTRGDSLILRADRGGRQTIAAKECTLAPKKGEARRPRGSKQNEKKQGAGGAGGKRAVVQAGLKVGSAVRCRWQKRSSLYPGRIAARRGQTVDIHYDDGDKETTTLEFCEALPGRAAGPKKPEAPAAIRVTRIEARSSNDWTEWRMQTTQGEGRVRARGTGSHMKWEVELPGHRAEAVTCIQGSEWWSKWQYRFGGNQHIAEASNATEWRIDSTSRRLNLRTQWSNDTSTWRLTGPNGTVTLNRTGGTWPRWDISDDMPGESIDLKMTGILAALVATEMPK